MEKMLECVGASKQPKGILKDMAGHDFPTGSTDPACEQSEIIIPKVENNAGHDLTGPVCEQSEGIQENMENIPDGLSHSEFKQPEGILQLIDKLESIVDQLLPRYHKIVHQ